MSGLYTNCGVITPKLYEEILCPVLGVDITHNNISFFHHMMCNWAYNIALGFQWVLVIEADNKDFLVNSLKQTVPAFEPTGWNIGTTADATWTDATQNIVGCIFAQGATLPGETASIERVGITEGSRRGFINAPIMAGRQDFTDLTLSFLETNRSFVEGVLRPWSILAMHKGLIAQPRNTSIKSTIHLYELAKTGPCTPNTIRKHWVFKDAVPVVIYGEDKTQSASSDYGKRQTSFAFNSYYIEDNGFNQFAGNAMGSSGSMSPPIANSNNQFAGGSNATQGSPSPIPNVSTWGNLPASSTIQNGRIVNTFESQISAPQFNFFTPPPQINRPPLLQPGMSNPPIRPPFVGPPNPIQGPLNISPIQGPPAPPVFGPTRIP